MATRLYFLDTTAAEPKPNIKQAATSIQTLHWMTSTLGGGQDGTGAIYPCDMKITPGASNATIAKTITEPGVNPHYGWYKAFISPPLAAQTISGTFTLSADFAEASPTRNLNPRIFIYVWQAGDTKNATNLFSETTSGTEANTTTGTQQTFWSATALTNSVAVSAGDRIVVEIMCTDANALTTSALHHFGLNGAVSSGWESYIEFSMDLAWNVAPTEAYAAEAILDYVAPTEVYASEAILDYLAPTEVYATETILDYSIPPTEVYATEAILDYNLPAAEVYAAEAVLDYIVPAEVYAAESILDYEVPPCEAYAVEAILDYIVPTEVYVTEVILDYEVPPCEIYAVESILDYTVAENIPCEVYAVEGILDYAIFQPCEAYAVETVLDYELPPPDPCEAYATEVILDYALPVDGWGGWWAYWFITRTVNRYRNIVLHARKKNLLGDIEDVQLDEE
jgi:hypothetical protein